MPKFSPNDRVLISKSFLWAKGATGTITEPPLEIVAVSGPWDENLTRQEESALGVNTVYWVGSMYLSLMRMAMGHTEEALFTRMP
jgi:hypothetical protein